MKIATFLNHTRNHFCLHFADSRLERDFSIFSHNLRLARYILFDLGTILLGGALLFLPTLISSSELCAKIVKGSLFQFLLSEGTWVAFFIIFHSIHIVLSYLYPEHVWDLLLFGHISPVWLRLIRWRLLPVLFLAAGWLYCRGAVGVSGPGVMKTLPLLFLALWQILAWRTTWSPARCHTTTTLPLYLLDLTAIWSRPRPPDLAGLLVSCQQMGRATVVAPLHNYHMATPRLRLGHVRYWDDQLLAVSVESARRPPSASIRQPPARQSLSSGLPI
ncbi:hypothetical protein PAPYR_1153 [Paratrimastix pyriformis]|uniref:Uncharacterized protein n=1 Tax=Paratrimastix pyriformis TaxID=342808 RepID=A0ABQ8UYN3_9EUKA|nr:hypothetical protein PAPYR_1153 [Paratrimastix pyriformis]